MRITILFGVLVCWVASVAANAQVLPTASLTLSSKYVSRGVNTVNNWVLQKNTETNVGNFTASLWGNMELTNQNGSIYANPHPAGTFTEWDFTLEYATVWRNLQVALGWIEYQYPGTGWERTREVYLSLSLDSPASPNLTVYHDLRVAKGTYVTAGIELPIGRSLSLSTQVGYGCPRFNACYYGHEAGGFTDLTLGLATTLDAGKGWQIKPTLWFSTLLDKRLLADQPNRQNVWFSVEFCRAR